MSNDKYGVILDHLLEGCMIIDFKWTYLYVNDVAAQHGLQKRENLIGRTMLEMYPGVEKTELFQGYRRCMEDRLPQRFEAPFKFADSSDHWYELRVEPIPEGIFVLSLEITERKLAEQALQASENRWRSLVELIPDYISLLDNDDKYLFLNHYAIGFSAEKTIGRSAYDFLAPESVGLFKATVKTCRQTKEKQKFEYTALGDNGKLCYYENYVIPLVNNGQVEGTMIVARDITERKLAADKIQAEIQDLENLHDLAVGRELKMISQEEQLGLAKKTEADLLKAIETKIRELDNSEELFKTMIENLNDAVFSTDAQGTITYISPIVKVLTGYDPSEVIGQPFARFIYQEDLPMLRTLFSDVLIGKLVPSEYRIVQKNGEIVWIRSSSRALKKNGQTVGITGIITKIQK